MCYMRKGFCTTGMNIEEVIVAIFSFMGTYIRIDTAPIYGIGIKLVRNRNFFRSLYFAPFSLTNRTKRKGKDTL